MSHYRRPSRCWPAGDANRQGIVLASASMGSCGGSRSVCRLNAMAGARAITVLTAHLRAPWPNHWRRASPPPDDLLEHGTTAERPGWRAPVSGQPMPAYAGTHRTPQGIAGTRYPRIGRLVHQTACSRFHEAGQMTPPACANWGLRIPSKNDGVLEATPSGLRGVYFGAASTVANESIT